MTETYAGSLRRALKGLRGPLRDAAPAGKFRNTVRGKRQPRDAASSATCTTSRRRCTRQDRLSCSHSRSSGLKLPVTVSSALMTDDRRVLSAARAGIARAVPAEAGPPRCCSGACLRAYTRPRLWLHFLWPAAGSHRCAGSRYPARPPGPLLASTQVGETAGLDNSEIWERTSAISSAGETDEASEPDFPERPQSGWRPKSGGYRRNGCPVVRGRLVCLIL
jgi:hypothetical protein